jgi:hypothetical protein
MKAKLTKAAAVKKLTTAAVGEPQGVSPATIAAVKGIAVKTKRKKTARRQRRLSRKMRSRIKEHTRPRTREERHKALLAEYQRCADEVDETHAKLRGALDVIALLGARLSAPRAWVLDRE